MIKFKTVNDIDKSHTVKHNDQVLNVMIQRMTGRVYEPGVTKLENGRSEFNDKVGKPDERLMVMGALGKEPFYKVVTEEELHAQFDEILTP